MPIGEDVPMLIPVSIVLTIFVLFLFSLYINFSERNEVLRMSETGLDLADLTTNIIFAENLGRLNLTKIKAKAVLHICTDISKLGLDANYYTKINISKSNTTYWWCWQNEKARDVTSQVTKEVPVLIIENNRSYAGKVEIVVSK
jgi:hypothetical protein